MNVQQGHAAQSARPPGTAALVLTGAARAVAAVLEEGASAEDALAAQLTDLHRVADPHRAAIQAVSLGALRWYGRLAPAVLPLLAKPGGRTEPQLRALLICAVHQLEYSTHAAATTVAAAVDAARLLGFERAAGLVNADLVETTWCAYAWPVNYGQSGNRTFFTNQGGDLVATESNGYSGTASGPASDAAFKPADAGKITGAVAIGVAGVDSNVWKQVN